MTQEQKKDVMTSESLMWILRGGGVLTMGQAWDKADQLLPEFKRLQARIEALEAELAAKKDGGEK